jgi:hypothetical protein
MFARATRERQSSEHAFRPPSKDCTRITLLTPNPLTSWTIGSVESLNTRSAYDGGDALERHAHRSPGRSRAAAIERAVASSIPEYETSRSASPVSVTMKVEIDVETQRLCESWKTVKLTWGQARRLSAKLPLLPRAVSNAHSVSQSTLPRSCVGNVLEITATRCCQGSPMRLDKEGRTSH